MFLHISESGTVHVKRSTDDRQRVSLWCGRTLDEDQLVYVQPDAVISGDIRRARRVCKRCRRQLEATLAALERLEL